MKLFAQSNNTLFRKNYLVRFIALGLLACLVVLLLLSYNDLGSGQSSSSVSVPRVLCYVLLDEEKIKTAKIVKETWGSHCQRLVFYGNFENSDIPVTRLNATEGYEYLWGKTKAALIHLHHNFAEVWLICLIYVSSVKHSNCFITTFHFKILGFPVVSQSGFGHVCHYRESV
jgi:hypothetical protein